MLRPSLRCGSVPGSCTATWSAGARSTATITYSTARRVLAWTSPRDPVWPRRRGAMPAREVVATSGLWECTSAPQLPSEFWAAIIHASGRSTSGSVRLEAIGVSGGGRRPDAVGPVPAMRGAQTSASAEWANRMGTSLGLGLLVPERADSRNDLFSLVAQRDRRVQSRGPPGRIDARDQPHAAGDADAEPNRPERHLGGEGEEPPDPRGTVPEGHADGAAEGGQEHRLDHELHQDPHPARAERLAQADLPSPLGDRDQHDVHDPDAAHDQREEAHERAGDGHHRGQVVEDAPHRLVGDHLEVVLLGGVEPAHLAEGGGRL